MLLTIFLFTYNFVIIPNGANSIPLLDSKEMGEVGDQRIKLDVSRRNNRNSIINEDVRGHQNVFDSSFASRGIRRTRSSAQSPDIGDIFEGILLLEQILTESKTSLLTSSDIGQHVLDSQSSPKIRNTPRGNCTADVNSVLVAAKTRLGWALEMIDATGKPEPGMLQENYRFLGNYDECIDVDTGLHFDGRYCTTYVWISRIGDTTFSNPPKFMVGLCFPSSCDGAEVEEIINEYFQSKSENFVANAMLTNCQDRHLTLSTKAIVVICICSVFAALLITATVYDMFYKRWLLELGNTQNSSDASSNQGTNGSSQSASDKYLSENDPIIDPKLQKATLYSHSVSLPQEKSRKFEILDQVLMSFSVYTNTVKLFSTNQSQDSISCIHGMKFISMAWVILVHTYTLGGLGKENISPFLDNTAYDDWTFMVVLTSNIAVDTFFAIGGILLTFLVLKQLSKKAVTPRFFAIFYFHRFWRLTPPYMLVMMTYVPLIKYVSNGPIWPQNGFEKDECEDTWWTNLLYLSNFIKPLESCMNWTWYLANDMQFYLVSPLLFIPMVVYQWRGLLVSLAFLVGSAICSGAISDAYDLQAVLDLDFLRNPVLIDYYEVYYFKPYTRIGAFVIGMVTGFLLFKFECKARLPKLGILLGWIAAIAIALSVVYGEYDHVRLDNLQSTSVRALYNSLARIAWAMSVCWVIFICANGYGGYINSFLSWNALVPLSRLGYCTYLVHPIVIKVFFYSQRKTFYWNNFNTAYAYVSMVGLSYALAYIASMAYEVPMAGLEKLIRGGGQKK